MQHFSSPKRLLPREACLRLGLQYKAVREHGISAYGPFFRLACLSRKTELTTIFHPASAAACENLMESMSHSNCSLPVMKDRGPVAISRLPSLDHGDGCLATKPHEISELTQLGVIVSKRVGAAVIRNKIKRRFREIYRNSRPDLLSDFWMVIIAAPKATTASFQELEKEWLRLGKKLSIFIS